MYKMKQEMQKKGNLIYDSVEKYAIFLKNKSKRYDYIY